jgi:hypothetical protein
VNALSPKIPKKIVIYGKVVNVDPAFEGIASMKFDKEKSNLAKF